MIRATAPRTRCSVAVVERASPRPPRPAAGRPRSSAATNVEFGQSPFAWRAARTDRVECARRAAVPVRDGVRWTTTSEAKWSQRLRGPSRSCSSSASVDELAIARAASSNAASDTMAAIRMAGVVRTSACRAASWMTSGHAGSLDVRPRRPSTSNLRTHTVYGKERAMGESVRAAVCHVLAPAVVRKLSSRRRKTPASAWWAHRSSLARRSTGVRPLQVSRQPLPDARFAGVHDVPWVRRDRD